MTRERDRTAVVPVLGEQREELGEGATILPERGLVEHEGPR